MNIFIISFHKSKFKILKSVHLNTPSNYFNVFASIFFLKLNSKQKSPKLYYAGLSKWPIGYWDCILHIWVVCAQFWLYYRKKDRIWTSWTGNWRFKKHKKKKCLNCVSNSLNFSWIQRLDRSVVYLYKNRNNIVW
jgi:hypothetical protein